MFSHQQDHYSLSSKTSYSQNFMMSRSRENGCYQDCITLKFDNHLGSAAAVVPVKFQRDGKILDPKLAASRLRVTGLCTGIFCHSRVIHRCLLSSSPIFSDTLNHGVQPIISWSEFHGIKALMSRQKWPHFANNVLKLIFVNKSMVLIQVSLKFISLSISQY